MKEVEVDKHKILLVKSEGQFSAVGSLCSHYGVPLIKGNQRKLNILIRIQSYNVCTPCSGLHKAKVDSKLISSGYSNAWVSNCPGKSVCQDKRPDNRVAGRML